MQNWRMVSQELGVVEWTLPTGKEGTPVTHLPSPVMTLTTALNQTREVVRTN